MSIIRKEQGIRNMEKKQERIVSNKEIYSFEIVTTKEVPDTKIKKDEEGVEVKETRMVKKKIPTRLVIARPTRKQMDEADLEFAIEQSKLIKKGILTRAMITKKYADTGGLLTSDEAKYLTERYKKLAELQSEFVAIGVKVKRPTKNQKSDFKRIIEEINEIRKEIADIESSYSGIFQHTADVKASNHVILWYTLMLTHIEEDEKEDGNAEWTPFFKGKTFEERVESYYEKEEDPDELYILSRQKLAYFISFWYNGAASDNEDFVNLEKDMEEGNV